ncbi:insulinase family protein [Aerococcus mictus]|uniref:insulinase family protein n=1 Tax=Aerococcus mictus TaxID=2976810 RepID=UPI0018A6F110|nr:insulinase family protein [Aerococcus mictus]
MNKENHGFVESEKIVSKEQGAVIHQFSHPASGGQVIWIANDAPHRAFGIGFLTPAKDSTGVAHIVEHTVLSGSRKYPVKDPFMYMLKSSMNTFLNAMTYKDMTLFPISSMNEIDFENLMSIYLDAVFFPRMYEEENIFRQEGYHKELHNLEDPITITGVVYNEMRGVYSDADAEVCQQIDANFHPKTSVAYESGGYPYDIPKLSYQDFLAFHKKHYRPDNALVVVYGDVNIDRVLDQLDSEYFSHFEPSDDQIQLELADLAAGDRRMTLYFDADDKQEAEGLAYLSYNIPFSKNKSVEDGFLYGIIMNALANGESSPLHKALVEGGYCQDVSVYSSGTYYNDFSLVLEKVDPDQVDTIIEVIEKTLKKIADQGLDRDLVKACLNQTELQLREKGGSSRGVKTFIQLMSAWRYLDRPIEVLSYEQILSHLDQVLSSAQLEDLIRDRLVDFNSRLVIVHLPKQGYHQAKDQDLAQSLAQEKAQASDRELEALIQENADLKAYQEAPDSPEAQASLPKLTLADIEAGITDASEEAINHPTLGKVLYHPQAASQGIAYFNFSFSANHLTSDQLFLLKTWTILLGALGTASYTYDQIEVQLIQLTAGLTIRPKIYLDSQEPGHFNLQVQASFAAMADKSQAALNLVKEILTSTRFEDHKRIKNILDRVKYQMEQQFDQAGHQLAMGLLKAQYSPAQATSQALGGLDYYDQLADFLADFDQALPGLLEDLAHFHEQVLSSNTATVAVTASPADRDRLIDQVHDFLADLPQSAQAELDHMKNPAPLHEAGNIGLMSNSNVQYVVQGGPLKDLKANQRGQLPVFTNIMSNEILHEKIRAQAGAYGAGLSMSPAGGVLAYSYRDPHLKQSLAVYQNMDQSFKDLDLNSDFVEQRIIGSLTHYQYPLTPKEVNALKLKRYFCKQSKSDLDQEFSDLIHTQQEDLLALNDTVSQVMEEAKIVVYGNRDKLQANHELFDQLRELKRD